jgi:S-(hydroxymethyl)glutathione dehydrogenase / alcohol dehydrogenase
MAGLADTSRIGRQVVIGGRARTTRAGVFRRVGQPIQVTDVQFLEMGPRDVLVHNTASGLCHSDLEIMLGSLGAPLPIVLGHELAGVVEAIGRDVTSLVVGDHVVGSWMPNCGRCFYCIRDQPVLCIRTAATLGRGGLVDGESRMVVDGRVVSHFSGISSHSQYSMLSEESAISIPYEMPLELACMLGCSVATGVGGVLRVAQVVVGSSVAVVGCGAVGLNSVQGARLAGADLIIALDRDPAKLVRAEAFGATHMINTSDADPVELIHSLTEGRGTDYVIESAGTETTMQIALEVSRPGGRVVILGKMAPEREVTFRFGSMMGERWITRSSYGGVRPARDFPLLCRAFLEGRLLLEELVDRRISFDEINDAFDQMQRGEIVRAILDPWRDSAGSMVSDL